MRCYFERECQFGWSEKRAIKNKFNGCGAGFMSLGEFGGGFMVGVWGLWGVRINSLLSWLKVGMVCV